MIRKQVCGIKDKTMKMMRCILLYGMMFGLMTMTGCKAAEVTQEILEEKPTVTETSEEASKAEEVSMSEEAPRMEEIPRPEESSKSAVNTEEPVETVQEAEDEQSAPGVEEDKMMEQSMTGQNAKKFSEAGALHVEGTQLTDSLGQPIQLRGTSTHGLAWFPQYVNKEFFLELGRDWNVNVVRLAMYTAENGGYCTDGNKEELKRLVKDGINYATEADLYVIVDWHILSDGNPHTHKEEAKKFFEEISEEFADHENIIYEICNEPNGNVSWESIKSYAEEIIPVIRANDEDAVIIVGTPTWSQDVDKAVANPITGYENIMYALHFYAATHTDWLRDRMVNALNAGLPIFVSEFGTCDASGSGGIDYVQADAWIQKMDEYGVSYVTWNLSNKSETSAIFLPGCYKKSGFAEEDFSENGKWIFEMLTGEHFGDCQETASAETVEISNEESVDQSDSIQGDSGELQYTATVSNSWESEGKFFYQYNVTFKNNSGKEIHEWKIELYFSDALTLSDGWNGNYTEKGNYLEITSKDYNGQIAPEGEVSDIGFIISGSNELKILNE